MQPQTMFVIVLTYLVPLNRIDEARAAHWKHLQSAFESGMYIAAGPQNPRTGGIILAVGERVAIEESVATDPFVTSGLASTQILEFSATSLSTGLQEVLR